MLSDNTKLRLEIEKIRKKLNHNDKNISLVLHYLDELLGDKVEPEPKRKAIG